MSVEHTDVGAYALGLLEDDDRRAFEAHLGGCASCTAELGGLAGMRHLLTGIGPVRVGDDKADDLGGNVTGLIERHRRENRRRRRGTLVIGLAAGAALVAGGITAGSAIVSPGGGEHHHGSPAADVLAKGVRHSATDPATRAVGIVATRAEPFGTEVGLDLAGVRGPLTCRLVAVLRSGRQQSVTEWAVPAKGYGVPGSREHLQVHGGISAKPGEVRRFDVLVEGGGRLVSIPV